VVVLTFAESEDISGLALQGLALGLRQWCTNADSDVRRGYALPWILGIAGQAESAGLAVALGGAQAISVAKYS